jgi:hypothetical protein
MSEELTAAMEANSQPQKNQGGSVNLGRHQAQCSICRSEVREKIEDQFIGWMSPDLIASKYSNLTRDAIYRHAHALDLFAKRRRNVVGALEKIIQKVDLIPPTGATILSAIKLLAKMESEKPPTQVSESKELFSRMSAAERETFAAKGTLPEWFTGEKTPACDDSSKQGGEAEAMTADRATAALASSMPPETQREEGETQLA